MYLLWGDHHRGVAPGRTPRTGKRSAVVRGITRRFRLPPGRDVLGLPCLALPRPRASSAADIAVTTSSPRRRRPPRAPTRVAGGREMPSPNFEAPGLHGAGEEATGRAQGTRTAGWLNNEGLLLQAAEQDRRSDGRLRSRADRRSQPGIGVGNLSDLLFAQNRSLDKSDDLLVRAFAHNLPEGPRYLIGRAIGYQRSGQVDRSLLLSTPPSPPSRTTPRCCSSAAAIASRPATAPRG